MSRRSCSIQYERRHRACRPSGQYGSDDGGPRNYLYSEPYSETIGNGDNMTDEIFKHDGYTFEFEAHVVSVNGDEVILDCTAFYPGGGGQVCDTGSIRGHAVTEVFRRGDDIIHVVPGNDLSVDERIWCSVDWERRYELMQGHTGEHLLFCSLKRQCEDLEITKIFISPESKYVIVNHDLTWEQIEAAVEFANQAIKDNHSVTKSYMDRDDPDLENVRIKLDRIPEGEQISVVAIGDIDLSACSGVHVMETSELEMLIVDRKVSAGKDGVTIQFKVGEQAKKEATKMAFNSLRMIDTLGCKAEDAERALLNLKQEAETSRKLLKDASKVMLSTIVPETVSGCAVHTAIVPGADRNVLNDFAETVRSSGGVAIIVSYSDSGSVMMASGDKRVDCKNAFAEVLPSFEGRGGGKPDFAQGGFKDPTKADEVLMALKKWACDALL